MATKCFICGDSRENSLEEHHIVPRRFGGGDLDDNLVTLCASCHSALEKIYDDSFYKRLGVEKEGNEEIVLKEVDSFVDISKTDYCFFGHCGAFAKAEGWPLSSEKFEFSRFELVGKGGPLRTENNWHFDEREISPSRLKDLYIEPIQELSIYKADISGNYLDAMRRFLDSK